MNTSLPQAVKCLRWQMSVRGAVQGVGYRPFVYRLAKDLRLTGWVQNSQAGLLVEVEGAKPNLLTFRQQMRSNRPAYSRVERIHCENVPALGSAEFEIRESDPSGATETPMVPDLATCEFCLGEIMDEANRRFRYPFTSCTACGPRFSIVTTLPYDRANTSMRFFPMCEACQAEYDAPDNRRFHAQANACPACGPRIEYWENGLRCHGEPALQAAADALRGGAILALQGIGGFHLLVDAANGDAVARLRQRKQRPDKPLAVLFPSLQAIRRECEVSAEEERILRSAEAPIVLLQKKPGTTRIASGVAPANPYLGAFLPYSPLHHLLLHDLGFAVVATSGNLSNAPICIGPGEARQQLQAIADCFLVHDRPINRPVEDSVLRMMGGRPMMLRRARGYAPLPIALRQPMDSTLAMGSFQKNCVALTVGSDVMLGQYLGDLSSPGTLFRQVQSVDELQSFYGGCARQVVVDAHPDAEPFLDPVGPRCTPIQHHYAHIHSCMADNNLPPPALGIAWDGTGYGTDGSLWGGEFLAIQNNGFERVAHLRTFALPGAEQAIREPRRCALGLLHEILADSLPPLSGFGAQELQVLRQMLKHKVNSPRTSSMGRLFDGVASLIGLRQRSTFEGQAAMDLEFACTHASASYLIPLRPDQTLDWEPAIHAILQDLQRQLPPGEISAKFHRALVEAIVLTARQVGLPAVVLSGGCFQNRILTEWTIQRLRQEGFQPYWHRQVPPNDGGIALGQIAAAAAAQNPQPQ